MLSSINFLFLLSLGFISWTILCYNHRIEQIHFPISKKPIAMEPSTASPTNAYKEAQHFGTSDSTMHSNDRYMLYVNFLGIFVCIYALAKITHLAEVYMARRIRHKVYIPTVVDDDNVHLSHDSLNELQEQQQSLKWKLNKLERQNQSMKFKLKEVVLNTTPSGHRMHADLEENLRSIIVTNKHVHLNGQIYVNQDEGQHKRNTDFKEMNKKECDNNNINVWDKYLQLQKKTSRENPIVSPVASVEPSMPVIMSSQDLKNIKGIL